MKKQKFAFYIPIIMMLAGLMILLSTSPATASTPNSGSKPSPLFATGVSTHGNTNYVGKTEEIFAYAGTSGCTYCHNSHGGTGNLATIRNNYVIVNMSPFAISGPIVFTSRMGTGSFDDGVSAITSRICVTCHINANRPGSATAMRHTGGAGHFFGDYTGQNCLTCHPHDLDGVPATIDGFMIKVGACDGCHGAPPATGSHPTHSNPATLPTAYGETGVNSSSTEYDFACGECHPTEVAKHMNGTLEVDLAKATAPVGSLKIKNGTGAAYDKVTTQTCSNVYCHSGETVSSGAVGQPTDVEAPFGKYDIDGYGNLKYAEIYPDAATIGRSYQNTPSWLSGSVSGNCTDCHQYPLTTDYATVSAGVGDSHQWINQPNASPTEPLSYGNLHAWNMGFDPLQCNVCHAGEITADAGWIRPAPTYVTTYNPVPIADHSNHVNGTANVSFPAANYVYPSATPLTVNLGSATYNANNKSCSNVGCHINQNYVVWGTPYRFWRNEECDLCHRYGTWPPAVAALPQTPLKLAKTYYYYDAPIALGLPRTSINAAYYDALVVRQPLPSNAGNSYHDHTPPPPNATCISCHTVHGEEQAVVFPDTRIDSTPAKISVSAIATFTFFSDNTAATFECSLDGTEFSECASGLSYSGLSDGSHTFQVRAKDSRGNVDPEPASYTWTIDTVPPDTQGSADVSNPTNKTDAAFTFSSADETAVFECALDGAAFAACASGQSYSGLSDGARAFAVRAKDPAGNVDATPVSYAWTIDTVPPETRIVTMPDNPSFLPEAAFTFSSTEAAVVFECSLDGAAFAACGAPHAYSNLAQGVYTFGVRAKDAAGNIDPTPAFHTWEVYTVVTATFTSTPANDGWLLNFARLNNSGGAMDNRALLLVGDHASKKQYRSILDFNTTTLPDNAVVRSATVQVRKAKTTGQDPFTTHGFLVADMTKGFYGASAALQRTDFNAEGTTSAVGNFASAVNGWYQLPLGTSNFQYVNLIGSTQFRMRFTLAADKDNITDLVSFYSGNSATDKPLLTIEYYIP